MTDTDADAGEFGAGELRHDVAQPVVPAVAAAALQAHRAGRQIDLVVRDQNPLDRDPVEPGDRRHRPVRCGS